MGNGTNTFHSKVGLVSFSSRDPCRYLKVLLSLFPLETEECFSAEENYYLFFYVQLSKKTSVENVVAVNGDNCKTKNAISREFPWGYCGCASYHFNLARSNITLKHCYSVEGVGEIMKNLIGPVRSATPCQHTEFSSTVLSIARWSPSYKMLKRNTEIRDVFTHLKIPNLDDLTLNARRMH